MENNREQKHTISAKIVSSGRNKTSKPVIRGLAFSSSAFSTGSVIIFDEQYRIY